MSLVTSLFQQSAVYQRKHIATPPLPAILEAEVTTPQLVVSSESMSPSSCRHLGVLYRRHQTRYPTRVAFTDTRPGTT